jgi:hypothetical protein
MFVRRWQEMEKLFEDEFNDLFFSPNINCMINSRSLGRARHVTYEGEERCVTYFGRTALTNDITRKT